MISLVATVHVTNIWFLARLNTHSGTGHKTEQFLITCICSTALLMVMLVTDILPFILYIIFGIATVLVFNTWFLTLPNTHPHTGHKTWQEQFSCVYIQLLLGKVMSLRSPRFSVARTCNTWSCLTLTLVQGTIPSIWRFLCVLNICSPLHNTHPRTGHKPLRGKTLNVFVQLLHLIS